MTARDRLAALQRGFSQVLRTPLDPRTGTLAAVPDRYDPQIRAAVVGDAAQRLAVYNRQYWFRLFGVMQQAYRLTTALVGPWAFNQVATRFLTAHPPRGHDLGLAVVGFAAFLAEEQAGTALGEAVRIDEAYRLVFGAPEHPPLRLGPADTARLARSYLRASPRCVVVEESRPLVLLRRELGTAVAERPHATPAPYTDGPRAWAICQTQDGQCTIPLARGCATLLALLRDHPVAEALALLEARVASSELAVERWFAEGMTRGFWCALDDEPHRVPEQPPRQ